MSRITLKDVEISLVHYAEVVGLPSSKRNGDGTYNIGALVLDYAPIYGGCRIDQITHANGASNPIFGNGRCSCAEMHGRLYFAIESYRMLGRFEVEEAQRAEKKAAEEENGKLKPGFVRCLVTEDSIGNVTVTFPGHSVETVSLFLQEQNCIEAFCRACGIADMKSPEPITSCPNVYLDLAKANPPAVV